jgi:hypothetical protein
VYNARILNGFNYHRREILVLSSTYIDIDELYSSRVPGCAHRQRILTRTCILRSKRCHIVLLYRYTTRGGCIIYHYYHQLLKQSVKIKVAVVHRARSTTPWLRRNTSAAYNYKVRFILNIRGRSNRDLGYTGM